MIPSNNALQLTRQQRRRFRFSFQHRLDCEHSRQIVPPGRPGGDAYALANVPRID